MSNLIQSYATFCEWAPAHLLIVSDNVFDPLIYYSHLVPVLLSLPLALIIFFQGYNQRINQLFTVLVTLFSIWSLLDLILWAHPDPSVIMFVWSLLILLEPLIYIAALVFVFEALFKRSLPWYYWLSLIAVVLPTIVLLPTTYAIEAFDLTNCYREVIEGPLVYYGYLVEIGVLTLIIVHLTYYSWKHWKRGQSTQGILVACGTIGFLLVFSSGNIIGSFTEDWTLGQYGIFGMPVLVAFIAYTMSRYKIFKSKIISTELLIGALAIFTISIVFVQSLKLIQHIAFISFVLVVITGTLLVRSVRKEVKQREEIEHLANRLEAANERLKELDQLKSEFVSIASHQLRSPLTSIRGYASMLLEGSFGKLSSKAKEAVERIAESSRFMALSVEDYLNVSRIQSGNMKYNKSDFDFAELACAIAEDLRGEMEKKGLQLTCAAHTTGKATVNADIGKTRQIIQNLLDNAVKYTPEGAIALSVRDERHEGKIAIDINDTGIGMSPKTINQLFDKFERAKNANSVNVTGTGLGLYIARKMAQDMGGDVTAHSEGEGKGSRFTFELPLQK